MGAVAVTCIQLVEPASCQRHRAACCTWRFLPAASLRSQCQNGLPMARRSWAVAAGGSRCGIWLGLGPAIARPRTWSFC
jgi:hypothetical protein